MLLVCCKVFDRMPNKSPEATRVGAFFLFHKIQVAGHRRSPMSQLGMLALRATRFVLRGRPPRAPFSADDFFFFALLILPSATAAGFFFILKLFRRLRHCQLAGLPHGFPHCLHFALTYSVACGHFLELHKSFVEFLQCVLRIT